MAAQSPPAGPVNDERGHALRWVCPECSTSLRAEALSLEAVEGAMVQLVREHCEQIHDTQPNPVAQVGGWLAAAGHLVELWGGPFDGTQVWCPPGELPDVVGMHRTADGTVVPVRAASARLLPHVVTYRLGELMAARYRGRAPRYLYDGRSR